MIIGKCLRGCVKSIVPVERDWRGQICNRFAYRNTLLFETLTRTSNTNKNTCDDLMQNEQKSAAGSIQKMKREVSVGKTHDNTERETDREKERSGERECPE